METVFKVRVAGPLAGWADGFHAELMALGYAPRSAQTHLLLMRRLSRWLDRAGLEPAGLTTERIQEFLEDCHRDGVRFPKSMSGTRPLVGFLRRHDVIPSAAPEARIGVDVLIDQFRRFLVSERGLADGTIVNYVHAARLLLGSVGVDDFDRLRSLTALDVQSFVLGESARRSVASMKCLVTGLRSLLRFFHVAGLTDGPLAGAVPTVSAGQRRGCLARSTRTWCKRCWLRATGNHRAVAGTTRCCCSLPVSVCGSARSLPPTWTTSIGDTVNCWCAARPPGWNVSHYLSMSVKHSPTTCVMPARALMIGPCS